MIRSRNDFFIEERFEMRGGNGKVRIEHMFKPQDELKSANRLCARLVLEPQVSIGFHRHKNEEELFVIVQGTAEIDDNGTIRTVHAGDAILTGGGAGHAVKNIGSDALEIIAVISRFAE